jgi:hypothetical protein
LSRQERELHSWQTITELQREIIVLEISDLVHRQLVSSALESDFRTHLEQNILVSSFIPTIGSYIYPFFIIQNRLARGAPPQQEQEQAAPRLQPIPAPIRRTTTNTQAVSI